MAVSNAKLARRRIQKRASAASPAVAVASKTVAVTPDDLPDVSTTRYRRIARPEQLPPTLAQCRAAGLDGDWFTWFLMCGRGWGKTFTGANAVNERARNPGEYIGLVGREADEVRSVMVEGPTGVLAQSEIGFRPKFESSKKLLTWPNGSRARLFYSEEPRKLRGPNLSYAWADEPASWKDADKGMDEDTTMSNLLFALREESEGFDPKMVVTGTPKPLKIVKELLAELDTYVVVGHTDENKENLSKRWYAKIVGKYEGTRLGRQELNAELLTDIVGALWKLAWIERDRIRTQPVMKRIVVGVDPNTDENVKGSECGIVVAGRGLDVDRPVTLNGEPVIVDGKPLVETVAGRGYCLADRSIGRVTPDAWARQVCEAYWEFGADMVIAEKNNGGQMVESVIKHADKRVPVELVWASRGKQTRAEPVSLESERGNISHVGTYPDLEDQLCEWVPGKPSPDRLDAYVWAFIALYDLGQDANWQVYNT